MKFVGAFRSLFIGLCFITLGIACNDPDHSEKMVIITPSIDTIDDSHLQHQINIEKDAWEKLNQPLFDIDKYQDKFYSHQNSLFEITDSLILKADEFLYLFTKEEFISLFQNELHQYPHSENSNHSKPRMMLDEYLYAKLPSFYVEMNSRGLGSAGQPHIMIRPLSLPSTKALGKARNIFFLYYILFNLMSITVGICARAVLNIDVKDFDPELALPQLAAQQLPGFMVGIVLAGVFASSISTADSQVLSCSAILGKDLRKKAAKLMYQKVITVIVILSVILIALTANDSVFNLVVLAWSVLAALFVPLVFFIAMNFSINIFERTVLMAVGILCFLFLRFVYTQLPLNALFVSWIIAGLVLSGLRLVKNLNVNNT